MEPSLITQYDQEIVKYDENPDFNQDIDDQYGMDGAFIEIAGSRMRPSEILFKVDPVAYHAALVEFRQEETENFKEFVFSKFPTPIAFNFERFERGYENQQQRLLLLRDTWEAVTFLLFALAVGEYRSRRIDMTGTKIKARQILSDSISDKLSTIEQLVQLAIRNNYELVCLKFVSVGVVEKLRELNRVRNEFSHSSAKSAAQCRQLIEIHEPEVLSILKEIREISNLILIRYIAQEEDVLLFRHEDFKGSSLNRTFATAKILPEKFGQIHSYLNNKNILAIFEGDIYCLSPFLHFKTDSSGNNTRLCFYKKKKGDNISFQLLYEVLDGSGEAEMQESDLGKSDFLAAVDSLRALLPDLSTGLGGDSE